MVPRKCSDRRMDGHTLFYRTFRLSQGSKIREAYKIGEKFHPMKQKKKFSPDEVKKETQ